MKDLLNETRRKLMKAHKKVRRDKDAVARALVDQGVTYPSYKGDPTWCILDRQETVLMDAIEAVSKASDAF